MIDPTSDPLAYFAPALLSLPLLGSQRPMISSFVDALLPSSLSQLSTQSISVPLMLKSSLILHQAVHAGLAGQDMASNLVEHLIEDITALKVEKVEDKRTIGRKVEKEVTDMRRRNAVALGRALVNDDELKGRFASLTSLGDF